MKTMTNEISSFQDLTNEVAPSSLAALEAYLIVFAATQDDTSNFVPAISARGDNDFLAIFTPIEPLNLPHVCLNSRILEHPTGAGQID
jgi:hypothetical protein